VARFSFNVLTLSLIYSTIAKAVTVSALGSYWFVVVGAFFVLGLSYLTATLLQCVWPIHNRRDFYALRISATFPNIVALPILIFPSLCEYAVVYEAFGSTGDGDLRASCVDQANTMIFCYFFSWSLCFWSLGHPQLMKAARMESSSSDETIIDRSTGRGSISSQEEGPESSGTRTAAVIVDGRDDTDANTEKQQRQEDESGPSQQSQLETWFRSVVQSLWTGIKQVATSAGFLAMLGGFVTACVPPLQEALF
jgi:predicted permease